MALKRIAFGVATLSAARVIQLASSFVAIPFLARMLTPVDFGLAALALSMVMFFTMIGDAGLGRSLVRVDASDTEAWSSAFWASVALMTALSLLFFLISWPAAAFFNEPRLVEIMMVLSLAPLLMGLAEIPAASLLQKEKFQWLAGAEFAAALSGIVVALTVAFNGGGAWALVWQHLTQRIVKGVVVQLASQLYPRLTLNLDRLKEHMRFMVDTAAWSMTMFVNRQADTLVVGKFLGAATLGLYNVAVRIMQLPVSILGGSLHSAVYPRFVKLREDNKALRELVLFTTMAQAVFVFPPIAAVATASHAFFTLLLSERWQASGEIFTLLAGTAAIQTVVAINGSLLQAIGRTGTRLRLTIEYAILWTISALVTAQFGIQAVALGCTVTSILYLPRLLHLYLRPIECSPVDFMRVLAAPTAAALALFVGHRLLMSFIDVGLWTEIGVVVLETIIAYAALVLFQRRELMGQLRSVRALLSPGTA
ncbi:MAG: lipopolysaccharide biosynthesis protein [Hyphomonadaceae bacterium]|nr:lipopolysaccharide biosynthesis protein [Hyphomonadaceae bacterium]MCA8886250.1 lipopolysaccharide biosynthesis protein [Hyphomonadaceae bacterium]